MTPIEIDQVGDTFPTAESLCEVCGYPLKGLPAAGKCPECGESVAASDPKWRPGLPWQQRQTFRSFVTTMAWVARTPRKAFRELSLDAGRRENVAFFIFASMAVAFLMAAIIRIGLGSTPQTSDWIVVPVIWAMATVFVLGSALLETLGVVFFSRLRGWRVPWRTAMSVTSYAMVGWLPAAVTAALIVVASGRRWLHGLTLPIDMPMDAQMLRFCLYIAFFIISLLWFESLVWLGVRRTRFANRCGGCADFRIGASAGV